MQKKAGLKIEADVGKLKKDLQEGTQAFDKFEKDAVKAATGAKRLEDASDSAGKQLSGLAKITRDFQNGLGSLTKQFAVGTIAANAITGAFMKIKNVLVGLFRGSIDAASALTELRSKAHEVFREQFDVVQKQVAAIAVEVQRAKSSILGFATDIGAIFDASGISGRALADLSTQVAKLAVDLASFYDSTDEDAFQALQSGLVGMVQPLRRYGIVLTQANLEQFALEKGITQSISTMNQAQLITLRYAYIMDKTATAQGDAARTAEVFANRSRGLKDEWKTLNEELGEGITPTLADGLAILSGSLQNTRLFVRALTEDVRTLVSELGSMASKLPGSGIVRSSIDTMKDWWRTTPMGSTVEAGNFLWKSVSNRLGGMRQVEDDPGVETDPLKLINDLAVISSSDGAGGSKSENKVASAGSEIVRMYEKLSAENRKRLQTERARLMLRKEMGLLTKDEERRLERMNTMMEFQGDIVQEATQAWREQVRELEQVEQQITDIIERIEDEKRILQERIAGIEAGTKEDMVSAAAKLIRERNELRAEILPGRPLTGDESRRMGEIESELRGFDADTIAEGERIAGMSDAELINEEKEQKIAALKEESDARVAALQAELDGAEINRREIERMEQEKKQAVIDALEEQRVKTFATYKALETETARHVEAQKANFNDLVSYLNQLSKVATSIENVESGFGQSLVPEFANGGTVFGIKGTDRVLAKVTAGEKIVNPIGSRFYGDDIDKMNALTLPRFATGGTVTNNNQRTASITVNNHGRAAEVYSDPTLQRWRSLAMLG